jgi:cold shock protein
MAQGKVTWFDSKKGYGFIHPDDGGNDVFVHVSAVEPVGLCSLWEGQKIAYELVTNKRHGKLAADNLREI